MSKFIIDKGRRVPKGVNHYHEYVQHPNWDTHYCCRVCGMAAPKAVIDGNDLYKTLIVKEG